MFNPYGAYQPPIIPNQAQKCEIVKVHGRNGAETFQMAANSSILLLDESNPIVWLAQTDGAGYKTLTPYKIEPYQEVSQTDMLTALEERLNKLEAQLNESNTSGNKYKQNNEQSNKQNHSN